MIPPLLWGQDHHHIYLTVHFPAHSQPVQNPPQLSSSSTSTTPTPYPSPLVRETDIQATLLNAKVLKVITPFYNVEIPLKAELIEGSMRYNVLSDACKLSITAQKRVVPKMWNALLSDSSSPALHKVVKIDWNKWPDESIDEDEGKEEAETAALDNAASEIPVKLTSVDTETMQDVPSLSSTDACVPFFLNTMTPAQRLLTLLHLWNAADKEVRTEFLHHISDNSATIENAKIRQLLENIKGGSQVFENLGSHAYDAHSVQYAEGWIIEFNNYPASQKLSTLDTLLFSLPEQELEIVFSTFV